MSYRQLSKSALVLGMLLACPLLLAQDPSLSPDVVNEYMNKPLHDWQLNLTSLLVASMFFIRVVKYLKQNGGIKNLFAAIWRGGLGGENVPDETHRKTVKK